MATNLDGTTTDETVVHGTHQHLNPDGETDAEKGAKLGGVGGAVTGALAGAMVGPAGALLGAVIGGVAGAVTSGLAVAAVDSVDGDSPSDGVEPIVDNGMPGIQTGGRNADGSMDTRGVMEKTADTLTGDHYDDKTGKHTDSSPLYSTSNTVGMVPPVVDNGIPGIQTGSRNADGSLDTRGLTEKAADALTGDHYDDKTGKRTDDTTLYSSTTSVLPVVDNGILDNDIPGVQTGNRNADGSLDTRGLTEKAADALTGDHYDDKTGKRTS